MQRRLIAGSLALATACLAASELSAQNRWIQQLGAAVPGKSFKVRLQAPTASNGKPFVWVVTPHTDAQVTLAPFLGKAQVNLNAIWGLVFGTFPARSSSVDLAFGVPKIAALVGLSADSQFLDGGTTPETFSDELVVTVIGDATGAGGVGSSVFSQGNSWTQAGYDLLRTQNTTVGKPVKLNKVKYVPETTKYMPWQGWSEGFTSTAASIDFEVGAHVHKRDVSVRDMSDGSWDMIATNAGKRLTCLRDLSKTYDWLIGVIDEATGAFAEIPGARYTNKHPTNTNINPFGDWYAISPDGKVAFVVVDHDDTGNGAANPPLLDQVWLVKLDGTTWPNKSGMLNVSPNAKFANNLDVWDRNVMAVGEGVFYRGRKDKGSLFFVPWDGSYGSVQVHLEQTGFKADPRWIWFDSYRVSKDRKTLIFSTGSGPSGGTGYQDQLEVYAIDNVTIKNMAPTGSNKDVSPRLMKCVTKFAQNNAIQATYGAVRGRAIDFNATLSRDGTLAAVIGGYRTSSKANKVIIVPTDGSLAGTTNFPVVSLGSKVPVLGTPHFLPLKSSVVVFGGTANLGSNQFNFDLWEIPYTITKVNNKITKIVAGTPVNLTKKGDLDPQWSMVSDNGLFFYFGRAHTNRQTNWSLDIVSVNGVGKIASVSGSEFGTGGTSLETRVAADLRLSQFRVPANKTGDMYFVARPTRTGKAPNFTFYDENVYKWNIESGGSIVRVTNHTGSSTSIFKTKFVENLQALPDGAVIYTAITGAPSSTNRQIVLHHNGKSGTAGKVTELGKFARGGFVHGGSVKVNATGTAVYWIQADSYTSLNTRGYFALVNNALKGHPVQLTDKPASSFLGNMSTLSVGSANN